MGLVRFLDAQQGLRRAALQRDARQTATETQRSERCGSVRMQLNVPVTLALWYMGKRDKEISSRVRNVVRFATPAPCRSSETFRWELGGHQR